VVNISKFFPRPKTPAEKLKQLKTEIVKGRSRKVYEITKEIALKKNKKYIGRNLTVFVDEIGGEKSYVGRTINYKPVVINTDSNILGRIINVEIVDAKSNFLIGRIKI